jgi:Spy/CpxP family protein refolding chaperone
MPETPPGKWWKRPRVVQLLKITPEQQEKLEEIFSRNRKAFVDLKADVEKNQIDVEELVSKKDSDPKKVSAVVDALEQSRMKLRKSMTMMFLEQRSVLTQVQWQQFLEQRDEWRRERSEDRRMGEMERRGELPPPDSKFFPARPVPTLKPQ